MRKPLSVLLLTVAPIALSAASHADDESQWYAGFDLGLSSSPEAQFTRKDDNLSLATDKNMGPVAGFYIGKTFGKRRLEAEYLVRSNYFNEFEQDTSSALFPNLTEFKAGGSQKNSTIMINGWQTLFSGTNWSLLGGAGLGLSHITLDGMRSGQTNLVRDRAWAPTWQLMAEYVRPIGTGLEFGLGYRIVRSGKGTFDTDSGKARYKAKHNELFARISWRFGAEKASHSTQTAPAMPVASTGPAPKPVAAPMTARPAKPTMQPVEADPAPLPKPFIVYFDFDKSEITSQGRNIINAAAKAYSDFKAIEIHATGHTDTSGPEIYNEKLAQARVEAVRNALVQKGIPASKIQLTSDGENSPAVNTADGIREKQNRRVEIKLIR